MTIWQSRPVGEVPEVRLSDWRIMQTIAGELHFVGVRLDRGTGRVSSAIVECDTVTRTGITRSGRRYVLDGGPGADEDGEADYVWSAWCFFNRITTYRDVTNEILANPK